MHRSRGDTAPAHPRHTLFLLIAVNLVTLSRAGPLGALPNVTSVEPGFKEGSCALGDVVYMPGDEFPGSTPCETCVCAERAVRCSKEVCEPRPGCKALHRPDHCCPTYQCECEQEGRVYGNGEKLVDPVDPCRVCYCQGGEVVCRRIACFVRDDCTPRLVPGRCCPEYDNCPLRGVTSLPGMSSTTPSVSTTGTDVPPAPPKENIKQKITIKEITPVSEIPVITEVKIKEILPSPSIEVAEYSSSKSPLMPREATSEKSDKEFELRTESPSVVEVHLSSPSLSVSLPESTQFDKNQDEDTFPSKVSFSTQDAIHSSIYPSNVPIVATMGLPPVTSEPIPVATTKAPMIEEEDTFDHNPAFPPIPDDLSVLRNHEDEIVPEPAVDSDHIHDVVITSTSPLINGDINEPELPATSTTKDLPDTTTTTTKETPRLTSDTATTQSETTVSTNANIKENPTLNLRSAIPTEIINAPSIMPEEMNGEVEDTTTVVNEIVVPTITTTAAPNLTQKSTEKTATSTEITTSSTDLPTLPEEIKISTVEIRQGSEELYTTPQDISSASEGIRIVTEEASTSGGIKIISEEASTSGGINLTSEEARTPEDIKLTSELVKTTPNQESAPTRLPKLETVQNTKDVEQTTSSLSKSYIATEVTSQTELSSLPIETSDQNPPEVSEEVTSDKVATSTIDPLTTMSKIPSTSSELITLSKAASSENSGFENIETTEFVLTSFDSTDPVTDAVELIKIFATSEKSADIIEPKNRKQDVLSDLISLVSDVASMSDHLEEPLIGQRATTLNSISSSEELIPVNAGYKRKNNNFNQNSITEIPVKSKNPNTLNKQKVIEIEDDESESVTDAPPPNDKIEPTTRRPIIDNVSVDNVIAVNKTSKKDIEIITQSYVPTISRRPTKVVLKQNNEKESKATDNFTPVPASSETTSDSSIFSETPLKTSAESSASSEISPAAELSIPVQPRAPSVEPEPSTEPKFNTGTDLNVATELTGQ